MGVGHSGKLNVIKMKMLAPKIISYSLVGLLLTVVHFALSVSLTVYRDLSISLANTFSFFLCAGMSFWLNGRYTFRSRFTSMSAVRYTLISVFAVSLLSLAGRLVNFLELGLPFSQLVVQSSLSFFLFVASDKFVFKK